MKEHLKSHFCHLLSPLLFYCLKTNPAFPGQGGSWLMNVEVPMEFVLAQHPWT